MGGFIKGVLVGVASFGLGFAILSVVFPVEAPRETAPVEMPEPPATSLSPAETAVQPVVSEPVTSEPVMSEPVASGADAPAELAPEETVPEPVDDGPLTEEAEDAPAAAEEAPVAAPAAEPEAEEAPESAVETAPANAMPQPVPSSAEAALAEAARAAAVEAEEAAIAADLPSPEAEAPEAAAESAEPETETPATERPGIEPPATDAPPAEASDTEMPVSEPVQPQTATAEASDSEALPTEAPAPAAPEIDTPQSETRLSESAAPVETEVATVMPRPQPEPEAEPETGVAPETATEAGSASETRTNPRPGPALTPVPATELPASEPLLPQAEDGPPPAESQPPAEPPTPAETPSSAETPTASPRVQSMPSGAAGVAVNRGGTVSDPAVRRGGEAMTGRLPMLSEAPQADPETGPESANDPDLPAVERYAATPALIEGELPMGVILFETAEAEAAILSLALPLTIALDPADPDAPRRAQAYRDAGHEIALTATGVPPLATPSDLAVTLEGWGRAFPQVVAIIDQPVNGLGANPRLARTMAEALTSGGLGALSLRDAPDAWLAAARGAGLPAAPVFRNLDEGGQNEFTVRRLIDRGAFEALRRPGIVVAGSASDPAVISELAGFARDGGRAGVGLAPVTAVLQGR